MPLLDANDPVCQLQDRIQQTLVGNDGATVIAALALTLSTALSWSARKTGKPEPLEVSDLHDDLIAMVAAIVRARNIADRES